MKRFYEGALPHGRLKRSGEEDGGADTGATAWVNGQEVRANLCMCICASFVFSLKSRVVVVNMRFDSTRQ